MVYNIDGCDRALLAKCNDFFGSNKTTINYLDSKFKVPPHSENCASFENITHHVKSKSSYQSDLTDHAREMYRLFKNVLTALENTQNYKNGRASPTVLPYSLCCRSVHATPGHFSPTTPIVLPYFQLESSLIYFPLSFANAISLQGLPKRNLSRSTCFATNQLSNSTDSRTSPVFFTLSTMRY